MNIRRGRDGGLAYQVAGGNSRQGARWWAGISGRSAMAGEYIRRWARPRASGWVGWVH